MRPVHIVVLLLAGALGGALIMKVAHQAKPAVPVAAAVPLRLPATAPPEQPEPAPAAVQAPSAEPEPEPAPAVVPERAKPSPMPMPVRREAPKPPPVERPTPPPTSPTIAPPPVSTEPEHAPPATPPVSAAPAPEPHQATLNAGLLLPVRLVDGLSSERAVPGDVFLAMLDQELVADGFVIAERGARVEGRVVAADRGGKARGVAALAVELTGLHTSDGQAVAIRTDSFFKHAEANHGDEAAKVAGGAIVGAMIGAIAGGGKGAAIGAGVGGGAGAGDVLLTRAKPAEIPSETRVTFRLKSPVPLTERLK